MEKQNFSEDLKINKFRLDVENEQHASMYHYWAEQAAIAKANKERAEDQEKLVKAEVELEMRNNPPDGVKITEKSVLALVLVDSRVKKAKQEYCDAVQESVTLDAAVRAMEHRKSNLDNLVVLYSKSYFSMPDGGKNLNNDRVQDETRKRLNKKRRQDA